MDENKKIELNAEEKGRMKLNMEERKSNLTVGKSYPAILINVAPGFNVIKEVYFVKFTYRVFLSPSQTEEVEVIFYLWDCPNFKKGTLEKIHEVMSAYNLALIPKDYRNEIFFANSCKWLEGTRVELSPYNYRGVKYKLVTTERKDLYRVDKLWKCMLNNNLEGFEKRFKQNGNYLKSFSNCVKELENRTSKEINEDPFSDFEDVLVNVDDAPVTEPKKKKRHCKRKKKEV